MSAISVSSLLAFGILAKFENSVAIFESVSICSIKVCEKRCMILSRFGLCSFHARCKCCTPNFIGVNGFLISCATCLAISRQALSRSERASNSALSDNSVTMRLYSFTKEPISSSCVHSISSFRLPSLIFPSLC
ncbi:MAG: hypothetical protein BWY67_02408 [Bacteroidetes bacterium ADurb.Bin397]|nr:MAG: hypothetical protein BWY67_02408 [Bacteroidetes bacterium ADurb.Bin397]